LFLNIKMAGQISFEHGRATEILIELLSQNLTTNRLLAVLDKRGTYDGPVQRTNVCGYLRVCREEGLVTTRKQRERRFHRHSLTQKGIEYLQALRERKNAE